MEREYEVAEHEALRNLQRFLTFASSESIVFVMSRDVFLAVSANNGTICRAADYSDDGTQIGIHSVYRGYDIYIVNEDVRLVFQPAIKAFHIDGVKYHYLSEGDYVLSLTPGDDWHVFSKKQDSPIMFSDARLTVRQERDHIANGRVTFADRIRAMQEQIEREVSPMWRMEYEPHWDSPVIRPASWNEVVRYRPDGEYEWLPQPYPWQPQLDVDEFERQLKEVSAMAQQMLDGKKPKRKKTSHVKDWDERLTPDDTKELDEFLDSLMQKGTSGSAS